MPSTASRIIRLAQSGLARDSIAEAVGASVGVVYTVLWRARRRGIDIPQLAPGRHETYDRAAAIEMAMDGIQPAMIGERLR